MQPILRFAIVALAGAPFEIPGQTVGVLEAFVKHFAIVSKVAGYLK